MPIKRKCGDCNACCIAFEIESLEKDNKTLCGHWAAGAGCSIYSERPENCVGFRCLWLDDDRSFLHWKNDRPDQLGVIFYLRETEYGSTTVLVRELFDGASHSEKVIALIKRFSAKFPVVIQQWDDKKFLIRQRPVQIMGLRGAK